MSWTTHVVLLAAVTALAGCIVEPSGQPLGAGAGDSLARLFHVSPSHHTCRAQASHGVYCSDACCDSEERETAEELNAESASNDQFVPSNFEMAGGEHNVDQSHTPWDATPDISEPDASHRIGPQSPSLDALGVLLSVASVPASAIGGIAHACVPAAAMGPPELPPPSRFNPVPTRPVFAPREPSTYSIPR